MSIYTANDYESNLLRIVCIHSSKTLASSYPIGCAGIRGKNSTLSSFTLYI